MLGLKILCSTWPISNGCTKTPVDICLDYCASPNKDYTFCSHSSFGIGAFNFFGGVNKKIKLKIKEIVITRRHKNTQLISSQQVCLYVDVGPNASL